ncbi:MAG: RidA family protein [Firmicutes bacterium]|nr:RidA family protein [Bacillota bacterium]
MQKRKIINPWQWNEEIGFVQANDLTGVKRIVYCAGQVSVDDEGNPLYPGNMEAQIKQALNNLETVLRHAGLELSDVVRLNYYTTDIAAFRKAEPMLSERLKKAGCRPVSTLLGVAALYHPDVVVEIEATAVQLD